MIERSPTALARANRFSDGEVARTFLLSGRARLTLVSEVTGVKFTYRIAQKCPLQEGPTFPHFVQLLNGPNNESDYQYLGTIFHSELLGKHFASTRASKISRQAKSFKAFEYAMKHLLAGNLPPKCEVWHEGRCGKCGRVLTNPSSITIGLGPTCSGMQ